MSPQEAYSQLLDKFKEISIISSCGAVLGWDERTYMPKGGAKFRAEQLSYLAGLAHSKMTDAKIGSLIEQIQQSDMLKDSNSMEAANVREIKDYYEKQTKLPQKLVEDLSRETSLAQGVWQEARSKNDFAAFLPNLEKVIELTIEKAEALGYEGEPYNALLDEYEPGTTVAEVEKVFEELRIDLVELLKKIKNAPNHPDESIIERAYDVELQRIFGESVAAAIGYDFRYGRLDVTTHPFCTGIGPGDTRITTRYNPNRINDSLFGIMHEAGHGLYEMGLEKEKYYGSPMGEATSLGIHESQSRMWENQVGRSLPFWKYFYPQAQRIFKGVLDDVTVEQFYAAINTVKPSYIRVEADEATYNLHILLRFELERAIVKKDLKPKDIPGEWNSRFEKYFGIKVDSDVNGCLQDVHWSAGLMGYFPTYTLGNLYSAQFFNKAKEDIPDMNEQFASGDFLTLRKWLGEKIHVHGQRYRAADLGKMVTGESLSHKPLIAYMTKKYGDIYGF